MKSGTVAVVGRANAGKSTLINALVKEKVSIVSPKPQTTRDRILGVLTEDDYQIVFIDTPGFYRQSTALNSVMQKTASDTAKEADIILYLIDAHEKLKEEDLKACVKIKDNKVKTIVCLTKTDISSEKTLIKAIESLSPYFNEIVPVSARKGKNLKELIKVLLNYLEDGEPLFTYPIISDKSEKFFVSEIIREKILCHFDKEIPHGVFVLINKFEKNENGVYEISADIICEKQNHKAILIGNQGSAIKKISTLARKEAEDFLGCKVFLTTYVKVCEDWRNNGKILREYGITEKN